MLLRRVLLLFLCICFLSSARAASPAERLAGLDILSQQDQRLDAKPYIYAGEPFRRKGCQPACIVNALTALSGDASLNAPELLRDLLKMMRPISYPSRYRISLTRLSYLTAGEYDDRFPTLNRYLQTMERVLSVPDFLDYAPIVQELRDAEPQRTMLVGRVQLMGHWEWLPGFTHALNAAGLSDVRLCIACLGSGTPSTNAPFRAVSTDGHYVTLYLEVGEFCADGTLYLLDSAPRALAGEAFGPEESYLQSYDFCLPRHRWRFPEFNRVCSVSRVSPTVLKVGLQPEFLQAMQDQRDASAADPALLDDYVSLRARQLSLLQLYGVGEVFLLRP